MQKSVFYIVSRIDYFVTSHEEKAATHSLQFLRLIVRLPISIHEILVRDEGGGFLGHLADWWCSFDIHFCFTVKKTNFNSAHN